MDAGDLNRRFVGTQVLEVILDKVGIAVRMKLSETSRLGLKTSYFSLMTTVPFCVNGTPKSTSPGILHHASKPEVANRRGLNA